MPKKARQSRREESGSVVERPAAAQEADPAPEKAKKYKPYEDKESLPPYQTVTTKRGKTVFVKGEPRYLVIRSDPKRFKLISVFRTPQGVERRLERVFRPFDRDRPEDRALLNTLKGCGVQGA